MRYMLIYYPADVADLESGRPPTSTEEAQMGAFIQEMAEAGHLILTDGLMPTTTGARVRLAGGKLTVTDGPFTEAKEVIAGFAIVEVDSKAQAVELAERFLKLAGDGISEIREMYPQPAFAR